MKGKEQQRLSAQALYITGNNTLQDVANIVQVSYKTVQQWSQKYNWDNLKNAKLFTKDEVLQGLKDAYKRFQEQVRLKGNEISTTDIDGLIKLSGRIMELQSKDDLDKIISVLTNFQNWLIKTDPKAAQTIAPLHYQYMEHLNTVTN